MLLLAATATRLMWRIVASVRYSTFESRTADFRLRVKQPARHDAKRRRDAQGSDSPPTR